MNSFDTLKQHLLFNSTQLLQAAEEKCVDQAFVFDTIYLAAIKTKQKYKKLANKERAVDVCISLMRQPRKHVKQSFASIEDCIEKAMAAKVVPWRPIISAVAVILVAAMLIPHLLPDEGTTYVDPSGFVMENTLALKNQVSGNNILLQNLHHPTDLGTEDETNLIGVPWSPVAQYIKYDCITTAKGETFLVATYVSTNGKNHEFILYKATTAGWIEVGRDTIKVTTITYPDLGRTYFYINGAILLSDSDGNVYIISCYDEGIQIHAYNTDGVLSKNNQLYVSENRAVEIAANGRQNLLFSYLYACYDESKNTIQLFYEVRRGVNPENKDENIYDHYTVTYNSSKNEFGEPHCIDENNDVWGQVDYVTCNENGAYHIAVSPQFTIDASGIRTYDRYIYTIQDGIVTHKSSIGAGTGAGSTALKILLLETNGDKLHLVYSQQYKYYHVIYQDGVEVERYRFYALSTDPIEYMTFFLYNDTPHYLASVNKEYLLVARIVEGKAEKIGEFVMPFFFLGTEYDIRRFTPVLSGGNVVNYLINGCEDTVQIYTMPTTYFFQIILN